jgi:GNAT superfamily N-acetyltransferase
MRPRRASRSRRRDRDDTAISVRPASLSDVETIVRFRVALLREHSGHPIYGRMRADAEERARRSTPAHLASGREITYLALEGRTPVAMLRCLEGRGSPLLAPRKYAYVASAYVDPSYRQRGILRRMVEAAIVWALERGLSEMRLHSITGTGVAEEVWERLGFSTVESLRRREIGPRRSPTQGS